MMRFDIEKEDITLNVQQYNGFFCSNTKKNKFV